LNVIIEYILDNFEKFIEIINQNKNNNQDYNKDISIYKENNLNISINKKITCIYESLKNIQNYFSDKITIWTKKYNFTKKDDNYNEKKFSNIDNYMQMISIKNYFHEILSLIKKIIFNYQTLFYLNLNINENKFLYESDKIITNIINDNSIFEELKLNPHIFLEESRQSIKNIFSKFTSKMKKALKKTMIVYHNKCYKHCDFTNYDQITRIKKRNHLVENPDRLNVLFQPPFGVFLSDYFLKNFDFVEQSKPGCLSDIVRIHDYDYVMRIKSMCENLASVGNSKIMKYGI